MKLPPFFSSLLTTLSLLAAFSSAAFADTPAIEEKPRYKHLLRSSALTLVTENDKYFAGTDRHYTNGLKISFLGTTRLNESPDFIRAVTRVIPTLKNDSTSPEDDAARQNYKVGVSFGQNMYTPGDTDAVIPDPKDRPYAGWLYTSLDFQAVSNDKKLLRMVALDFGVVGPAALGRQAQNTIHNWMNIPEANGWDYQLRNEPGLILSWERRHRLLRFDLNTSGDFSADLIGRYGLALGNIRTHAAGGINIRVGWRLPEDFGSDLIRSAGGDEAPAAHTSIYVFASGETRAVARNIFLDGNTWRDSPSVDKRPIVADLNAGLVLRFPAKFHSLNGLQLAYIQNYRTKEFYGQLKRDVFGSISLSLLF